MSQIADKFVENALDFLKVGQEVKARVLAVDLDRKRISLSLKSSHEQVRSQSATKELKKKTKVEKPKDEKIKNNAFSALKNIKFK